MTATKSKRIVIVEDDTSVSQSMERLLRLSGFAPVVYASAEALLIAPPDNAACLILDVQLPGLGGFALYDQLAQAGELPPVIFVTAFDEPDARAQASRAGAVAFLAKPFTGRVLLQTIERALHLASPT